MSAAGRMSIRRRRHHGRAWGIFSGGAATAAAVIARVGPGNITDGARCAGGVLGGASIGRTSADGERNGESAEAGGIVGGSDGRPAPGIDVADAGIAPIPAN